MVDGVQPSPGLGHRTESFNPVAAQAKPADDVYSLAGRRRTEAHGKEGRLGRIVIVRGVGG
jgi:hypothetical protein